MEENYSSEIEYLNFFLFENIIKINQTLQNDKLKSKVRVEWFKKTM